MNKRIDELMIQAGARFEFLHGVHYDDFQYRKFAELIVAECVAQCEKNKDHEWLGSGSKLSAFNIREHFGVAE